jgi:TonB family protein
MLRALNLTLCCLTFASISAPAQVADNAPPIGVQAVRALTSHLALVPKTAVPKTGQQLATNGHWSMANQSPAECAGVPAGSGPCLRLIYAVPDASVSCEWVLVLSADAKDVTFLDENDDAARYFMPKLSPAAVKSLVQVRHLPVYPPIAQAARVQGDVKLPILVRPDGNFSATSPIGPPMLTQAAVDALSEWRFKPLQIGSRAVAFEAEIIFHFEGSGFPSGGTVQSTP